jgi:O-acetyl-ADP-ribose deacetylase (regulator of RNase III)
MAAPMTTPIEIDVWQGEIAELEVDALVVGASESLFMTGGQAASVKRRGGPEIEHAAVQQGPIPPGSVIVTSGGRLAAPYVIHAVAVGHDRIADPDRILAAVRAAFAVAEPLQLRRIAIGLLGAEHGAFTPEDAATALVAAVEAAAPGTPIDSVVIATAHPNETHAVGEALARHHAAAR